MKAVVADIVPKAVEETVGRAARPGSRRDRRGHRRDVARVGRGAARCDARRRSAACTCVCNNAGIGSGSEGHVWEHHVNDWRWSLDVNVMGVVNGINAFVPHDDRAGRGGSRRQHDVGQRRLHPADQQRDLRDDQGRGDDDHRVPVGPAPRGRIEGRARRCCTRRRARPVCSTPGIWRPGANRPDRYDRPGAPPPGGPRLAQACTRTGWTAIGQTVAFAPLSEVADICFEGIRDDVFWITAPSDDQSGEDPGPGRRRRSRCPAPTTSSV